MAVRGRKKQSSPAHYGTGRRKCAVARVFLRKGGGAMTVNKRSLDAFFTREISRRIACQPLAAIGAESGFDIFATVRGGGESGQAGAIRHGIARALVAFDREYKPKLRAAGLISRDPRAVERKKVGLHKARRAKQFSKR